MPTTPHAAGAVVLFEELRGLDEFLWALRNPARFPMLDRVVVEPPQVRAFNTKYKGWHHHADDEVRFFSAGTGTFTLGELVAGAPAVVRTIKVRANSYLSIPAGTIHRFQCGRFGFVAVRLFSSVSGGGIPIPDEPSE